MSFADACLAPMTETLNDAVLLTKDVDFRVYRRHGRQAVPCLSPCRPAKAEPRLDRRQTAGNVSAARDQLTTFHK